MYHLRKHVDPETFVVMQNVNVDKLFELPVNYMRPILPCLVRMSLCVPLDSSDNWTLKKKKILRSVSGIEVINSLVSLLSIDFHALEQDARKEQQLRKKTPGPHTESVFIAQLEQSIALEFERCDAARKLRLLVSELLFIVDQVKESKSEFYQKSSELFENEVYFEEVSDVLCIAQAELPNLLSMTEAAEALMHVNNGVWLLCRLVCNVPDTFYEVCHYLVTQGDSQDDLTPGGEQRRLAVLALCDMNPSMIGTIQNLCVSCCRMPGLAIMLSLRQSQRTSSDVVMLDANTDMNELSSVVVFVCGLLLGNDQDIRIWFAQHIKSAQKRKDNYEQSSVYLLRRELLRQLNALLQCTDMREDDLGHGIRSVLSEKLTAHGCTLIRLYAGLKSIATLKFTEEECSSLLRLIVCCAPLSSSGNHFIMLALSLLISCPNIISTTDQERIAIDWLKWLVKKVAHYEKVSAVKGSFGEMLLLIAIHFHSNQTHAVIELVSSSLGLKSAVKGNALSRMKTIFTQDVFTEQVVSSHAVQVQVTESLSSSHLGFLPIHCIHQLLSSRTFSKHKVSIKTWIYHQLRACTTPLHPLVAPLIEVYVQSVIVPSAKTDRANQPISETEILDVFEDLQKSTSPLDVEDSDSMSISLSTNKAHLTPQLLLLYYVMLYEDVRLNNLQTLVTAQRKVKPYSANLISRLPIKFLMTEAQKCPQLYAGLFSPLVRLLVNQYPHLCLVEDWLDEAMLESKSPNSIMHVPGLHCTTSKLTQVLSNAATCPGEAILILDKLITTTVLNLLPFMEVLSQGLKFLLAPEVPRKVQDLAKDLWLKMNTMMPRKLRVLTVNGLKSDCNDSRISVAQYTEDELTLDPLLVLKCDTRTFRCPPILAIVLRVLNAYMHASRSFLSTHIMCLPAEGSDVQQQTELKGALVAAQDSAIAQLLLEICLTDNQSVSESQCKLTAVREVQCLVCSSLHQMFITDPALAKLLHFQGYPKELLPMTVKNIPSIHICLDFIPELLSQPDVQKQVFAIELISYLSEQYALPKTLSVAELTIDVMTTLLTVLPNTDRPSFFLTTLPCLLRISRSFPPLSAAIVTLLSQLGRICMSHIASAEDIIASDTQSSVVEATLLTERSSGGSKSQKHQLISSLEKLSSHRQLYIEIQNVFSELISSSTLLKSVFTTTQEIL